MAQALAKTLRAAVGDAFAQGKEDLLREVLLTCHKGDADAVAGYDKDDLFEAIVTLIKTTRDLNEPAKQLEVFGAMMEVLSRTRPTAVPASNATPATSSVVLQTPLKDFKLSGTIDGGTTALSYCQLTRDIANAKQKGYKDEEIISGVLRAVKAGSELKKYLEGRQDLTLERLNSLLRLHYNEKSPTELYHELMELTQRHSESGRDYVMRGMALRDKIINMTKLMPTDTESYPEELVKSQFKRSLTSGLREEILRVEMKTAINSAATDEDLLQEMDLYVRRQDEVNNKKKMLKAKAVECDTEKDDKIRALEAKVAELELQRRPRTPGRAPVGATGGLRPRPRCPACPEGSAAPDCSHCWKCGSTEHRSRWCPSRTTTPKPADFGTPSPK